MCRLPLVEPQIQGQRYQILQAAVYGGALNKPSHLLCRRRQIPTYSNGTQSPKRSSRAPPPFTLPYQRAIQLGQEETSPALPLHLHFANEPIGTYLSQLELLRTHCNGQCVQLTIMCKFMPSPSPTHAQARAASTPLHRFSLIYSVCL